MDLDIDLVHLSGPYADDVRAGMLDEFDEDVSASRLYQSAFLTDVGLAAWPDLLREALATHLPAWLAAAVDRPDNFRSHHIRATPSGGSTTAKVPTTAPVTLAMGQFLRYYLRAVAATALAHGKGEVRVSRLRIPLHPRPESESKVGLMVSASALLEDLRRGVGIETFLGIPAGPNSGLGVEIV